MASSLDPIVVFIARGDGEDKGDDPAQPISGCVTRPFHSSSITKHNMDRVTVRALVKQTNMAQQNGDSGAEPIVTFIARGDRNIKATIQRSLLLAA